MSGASVRGLRPPSTVTTVGRGAGVPPRSTAVEPDLDGSLPVPDLPGEFPYADAITIEVACRAGESAKSRRHDVRIYPDWTVDTGHDLDLERIAAALGGGRPSCLTLADQILPAIRDLWLHLARRAPIGIKATSNGKSWEVCQPVPGCACTTRWTASPDQAAGHLRTLDHWAAVHQVRRLEVTRVWQTFSGQLSDLFPLTDRSGAHQLPNTETTPATMRLVADGPEDADALWLAGIHPDWALAVRRRLPTIEYLKPIVYLHIATRAVDLDWLAGFAPYGAQTLGWAARTYGRYDTTHPDARREWLECGLAHWTVDRLVGSPYQPADIHALAPVLGLSPNLAAAYLGDWVALKASPTIDQLIAVWALPDAMRRPPNAALLRRVSTQAGAASEHLDATDLALVVAACGSAPAAIAFLQAHQPDNAAAALAILRSKNLGPAKGLRDGDQHA